MRIIAGGRGLLKRTAIGAMALFVLLPVWSSYSHAECKIGNLEHTQDNLHKSTAMRNAGQSLQLAYELGESRSPSDKPSSPYPTFPNRELVVQNQLRMIVFSPHPDDETLSSGGLIQRVLSKGGQVRVVFITNGDGFLDGVRCEFDRQETTSQDFIEYGRMRHKEALQALHELGLQPGDGIFLGFPDDGIDDLLDGHWSKHKPFISPHTRFDHPQYKESFNRWVKYSANDLRGEIERILTNFSPDWVVLPDPRDNHPDHSSTGIFVLDSLRKLKQDGNPSFANVQAFTYLVHYPGYPETSEWLSKIGNDGVGGSPAAYRALSEASWHCLPITSEELAAKRRALAAHESQFAPLYDPLLKYFLIRYELFFRMESSHIMSIPIEYAEWFEQKNRMAR